MAQQTKTSKERLSRKADDEQIVRATLGRLLFSGDETKKSVKVLSGGEKGRMIYGKLTLTRPNILLMDEPTNHMDMETIESLQIGLEHYPGTLIFVSHDDGDVPAFAGPHPRLGERHQRTHPVHPDGLVFPFRHDPVRHQSSPYARDTKRMFKGVALTAIC